MTNGTEEQEAEYYEMTPREHVYTTRSGRKVYSTPRLVVPIPDNDEDAAELAAFDATHGEDCMDGLSECSHTCKSNTDAVDGEEEEGEDDGGSYKELPSDTDPEDDDHIICDSDSDSSEVEIEEEDEGSTDEEEESDNEEGGED
jgi:hypothetical protein